MRRVITSPQQWRPGFAVAAAALLTAILACLALVLNPLRSAAATAPAGFKLSYVYGCDLNQDGQGNWVEVSLQPTSAGGGASVIYQIGLASSANDQADRYPDVGGPVLVRVTDQPVKVVLTNVVRGEHLYVRPFQGSVHYDWALPANCTRVARTVPDLADPTVIKGASQANCLTSNAVLTAYVENDADVPMDVTVYLVNSNGTLNTDQAQLVTVPPGRPLTKIFLSQEYHSLDYTYNYQVRVVAPDGGSYTTGDIPAQCDSQGHRGPAPSGSQPRPTVTVSASPPASSPRPKPTASASRSSSVARSSVAARSSAVPGPVSSNPASVGFDGGAAVTGGSSGGPVLGDADSTSQPPRPAPTVSSSPRGKQTFVEAATVTGSINSGIAIGGLLVVLAFGTAVGGMVSASRANARRR